MEDKVHAAFIAIVVSLIFCFLLLGVSEAGPVRKPFHSPGDSAPGKGETYTEAENLFLAGRSAFNQGRDKEAADYLIEASRLDWQCLSVLRDMRYTKWLPVKPCGQNPALRPVGDVEDAASETLYRLALLRRSRARKEGVGEARLRKEGHYFLERLVSEGKGGSPADLGALMLVEDGFCLDGAGYPECKALEIEGYESWLERYPESANAPEVMKRMAERYLELADDFERPEPWRSEARAELCRGKAVVIARRLLKEYPGTTWFKWAEEFIAAVRESGVPFSIVPDGASL